MDNKKKRLIKELMQYSMMSSAFLLSGNVIKAQVTYFDVDPDLILDIGGEGAYLDIDNNGTIDFVVLNSSFTFTTFPYENIINRRDLLAGPFISQNYLAGTTVHYSTSSGGWTWAFPYALSNGQKIDSNLEWRNNAEQFLAEKEIHETFTADCFYCHWFNESNSLSIFDHYIGIAFLDFANNNHFGWIRCDVKDLGRTLVIKDYAFETMPNHAIFAGDTTHYVTITEPVTKPVAKIFSRNNFLTINTTIIADELSLSVFDVNGKEIESIVLNSETNKIPFIHPTGIYFYSLSLKGEIIQSGKIANL